MVATKTKSTTTRKNTAKPAAMRSFVLTKDAPPFFSIRLTHQTAYWLILCGLILALGIWVVILNMRVQQLYDQIEVTNSHQTTAR